MGIIYSLVHSTEGDQPKDHLMEANLALSLEIANRLLEVKQAELDMLVITLQETNALSDELVCLCDEFWDIATQEVNDLKQTIISLEEQKKIFGKTGLQKELEIVSSEDYSDDQQPENN